MLFSHFRSCVVNWRSHPDHFPAHRIKFYSKAEVLAVCNGRDDTDDLRRYRGMYVMYVIYVMYMIYGSGRDPGFSKGCAGPSHVPPNPPLPFIFRRPK